MRINRRFTLVALLLLIVAVAGCGPQSSAGTEGGVPGTGNSNIQGGLPGKGKPGRPELKPPPIPSHP